MSGSESGVRGGHTELQIHASTPHPRPLSPKGRGENDMQPTGRRYFSAPLMIIGTVYLYAVARSVFGNCCFSKKLRIEAFCSAQSMG